MAKTILYGLLMNGMWLQDTVPNEHYCSSSRAPTMGTRHDVSEFVSVWGLEPKFFGKHTVAFNLNQP